MVEFELTIYFRTCTKRCQYLLFLLYCRIVLERPEYGYATYFFELHGSLPVDWQIKRLVTAMNLISCSRISLIENKALLVINLSEPIHKLWRMLVVLFSYTAKLEDSTIQYLWPCKHFQIYTDNHILHSSRICCTS